MSPQASSLEAGITTLRFGSVSSVSRSRAVKGCFHMRVFIAGQMIHGRDVSQARKTQLCRPSSPNVHKSRRGDSPQCEPSYQGMVTHQKVIAHAMRKLSQRVCTRRSNKQNIRPFSELRDNMY